MTTAKPETGNAPFAWSEALSVGVPEIDSDHKVLFELISQIDDSGAMPEAFSVIGTILAALSDYTEYHFAREDRMLDAIGYPQADDHKHKHQLLKQQVQHYLGLYSANHDGLDTQELYSFLQSWLYEHIQRDDLIYAPYCVNNPAARDAASSVGLDFFMDPETSVF